MNGGRAGAGRVKSVLLARPISEVDYCSRVVTNFLFSAYIFILIIPILMLTWEYRNRNRGPPHSWMHWAICGGRDP